MIFWTTLYLHWFKRALRSFYCTVVLLFSLLTSPSFLNSVWKICLRLFSRFADRFYIKKFPKLKYSLLCRSYCFFQRRILYFRLTLFIASSSFIIMTLITIIGVVSCVILCNDNDLVSSGYSGWADVVEKYVNANIYQAIRFQNSWQFQKLCCNSRFQHVFKLKFDENAKVSQHDFHCFLVHRCIFTT